MNAEVDVRIDHKIGNFFIQHLKDAQKRLWIVSPWISVNFIDLVLSKKSAGVDVRVLTSNDYVSGQKEALRRLVESRTRVVKPENKKLKYIGIAVFLIGFLLAIYTKSYWIILISFIGVVLYLIGREQTEDYWVSKLGEGNLRVFEYHPYRTVHAKIYIADDRVIIGSANFTQNGLVKNIEGMAVMKSEEFALKMIEMVNNMKTALNLKELSYDDLGENIQTPDYKYRFRRYYRYKRKF